ncbi:MAG: serine/threonine protein kinase [Sandaracinaceae bacterium]|nr:MAG: serine/threonine protein kinase [Sandaracinaceae bacterium]
MLTPDPTGALRVEVPPRSLVGALVAGKYRLRRVIGRGGMGTVYKAENVSIGRTVAVKVLHGYLADDGVSVTRFQREARAAASVGHEHIIEVLDMGIEPNGAPFIVMEYVRGKSLAQALRDQSPFAIERAVPIVGQILAGLEAAHDEGIIHRDLKPENILLMKSQGRTDFVKLFDFGVAAFVDAAQDQSGAHDLTPTGRAMGTPTYASPEQMLGKRVRDARVDLYSVGVLLFRMLAGRLPFDQESFPELCRAITELDPPRFVDVGVEVPAGLEEVVGKALAKDPNDRFQSAREMAEALVPFGAAPPEDAPETTDTLTMELRELRAREALLGGEQAPELPPGRTSVVRGEALGALLAFVQDKLGEVAFRALIATEPEIEAILKAGLVPNAWYPGGALMLVERVDRERFAGDRRLVAEAGRYLAQRAFLQRDRDMLLKTLTPELFFSLLPELWTRYFAVGEPRVVKVGRGYGRLEITNVPDAFLARSVAIAGYLDQALRMAGAADVDVRLASAAALGDAMDVFEATWSS